MLGACLQSIRDLVDEIVLVDTGSRDGTKDVARSFGARVYDFVWCEDFSAARNAALDHARGSWVLYVDADERVVGGDRDDLEGVLRDPAVVACTVRFTPQRGYTPYREYRVFRNDPAIRFRGVIHESVLPALNLAVAQRALRIAECALAIEHIGYDGNQTAKHRRNLPLLRARVAAEPGHVYCLSHLGRVLLGLGDRAGAETAWRQALEAVRAKVQRSAGDCLPYIHLVQSGVADGHEAPALLDEGLQTFPGNHLLAWFKGRALMTAGAFAEAIPILEALAAVDADDVCHSRVSYDARIFGELAYDSLAWCHFQLGQFDASARCYALAEACVPGSLEYAVKRRLAEAHQRA